MKPNIKMAIPLITLVLISTGAFATKVKKVHIKSKSADIVNGTIEVESDGKKYTRTKTKSIAYTTQLSAQCKNNYRINQALLSSKPFKIENEIAESNSTAHRQNVSVRQTKELKSTYQSFTIPVNKLTIDPVAACNRFLDAKIREGFSPAEVLRTDKFTQSKQALTFAVQCKHKRKKASPGKYWGQDTVQAAVNIKCGKTTRKPRTKSEVKKPKRVGVKKH